MAIIHASTCIQTAQGKSGVANIAQSGEDWPRAVYIFHTNEAAVL